MTQRGGDLAPYGVNPHQWERETRRAKGDSLLSFLMSAELQHLLEKSLESHSG